MRWIRVEVAVGDSLILGALADALGVSVAEAIGLHVLVWAKLPEHAADGALGAVADTTLERWATWTGKKGAFARAYRAACCDENGNAREWERVNGAAMRESAATAVRVQKLRAERKKKAESHGAKTPYLDSIPRRGVRRTDAVTHASDGDGTAVPETAGTAVENTDLSKGEANPQRSVEKSHGGADAPSISPVVTRFMARFYGDATAARRADIARQMCGAIINIGVRFKGETVKAIDQDHLDDVCLAVMEDPPREPNAAWVFVLQQLKETYLGVLSARAKAEIDSGRAVPPKGLSGSAPMGATPIRAAIAGVLEGLGASESEDEEP